VLGLLVPGDDTGLKVPQPAPLVSVQLTLQETPAFVVSPVTVALIVSEEPASTGAAWVIVTWTLGGRIVTVPDTEGLGTAVAVAVIVTPPFPPVGTVLGAV
jgi:hypothetical protein